MNLARPYIYSAWSSVVLLSLLTLARVTRAVEVQAAPGFAAESFIRLRNVSAFTWDEHGLLWVVSENNNRLVLNTVANRGEMRPVGSFERRGNERASLLVHADKALVSDGGAIRQFHITDRKFLSERAPFVAPSSLFPDRTQITSLDWSPLGNFSFLYRSNNKIGVGRFNMRHDRWDVIAKGLLGDVTYDLAGFPVISDESSDLLFRLRLGVDYENGLHNYRKSDLALATDSTGVKPRAIVIHPGAHWPEENRGTWLISDHAASDLKQFKEDQGRLKYWRTLAHWNETSHVDLQIGPDGVVWLLLDPAREIGSQKASSGSIYRLHPESLIAPPIQAKLATLETKDLIAVLKNSNSWQRQTALRVLDDREELRQARGLHPGTGLHHLYNDTNATVVARIHALLSLHRLELLDETMLENVGDASDPSIRAWAALLFGERNYPTGVAFDMLVKLAREADINVRMAAAIAARQFVSGSLAIDTAPRAMPIREVFTGGILSTLWFSTEKSRSPEFDLLFWNAVKPISAYDAAHPMGFMNGDREEGLPIAYWIVGLITQQIAEQENPLKQEDAMLMVGQLKPQNARMITAALEGLKKGSARRQVVPTEKSLAVLGDFTKSANCSIAKLAEEILALWNNSVP